jgi:hypothetical protein
MSKYQKKILRLKKIQIILIILCLVASAIYLYFITKPEVTKFTVDDECGPIGGTVSHSIDDDDSCSNACNAYCISMQKKYKKSSFKFELNACNTCTCYCQESREKFI